MTNNAFLVKIIPPKGLSVYRLHFSRATALGLIVAVALLIVAALGVHAWQLHDAQARVAALAAQAAAQNAQLRAIDRQADALAGQLRDLQREDNEIRRMLGVGAPPAAKRPPTHAFLPAAALPTATGVQARYASLTHASQVRLAAARGLKRLAHRVLNLRRLALEARVRLIAALPSLNPVDGAIVAGFGWRVTPWPEFHRGLDLAADFGTPVRAAADGTVASAGWDSGGFGIKVDLDHANGYHTWYAHLSRVAVSSGQHVHKGELIAYVGATGEATGPHLHYQVMLDGRAIDPAPYLTGVPARVLATLPSLGRVQ